VGLPWSTTVDAARETRALLERAGMRSFVKTTGGKGLHVVVPLVRSAGWDEVHRFAGAAAAALERESPGRYLTEASKEERHGKVFVDWLRNSWSASAVAAYSTRSRPGAPVSTPVTWDELDAGIDPREFTVQTVPARVERERADPWGEYDASRARITRAAWKAVGAEPA
jgi:bifunctional non-homologous end joining protein LigD